jgi:hypothetical protein
MNEGICQWHKIKDFEKVYKQDDLGNMWADAWVDFVASDGDEYCVHAIAQPNGDFVHSGEKKIDRDAILYFHPIIPPEIPIY